MRVALSSEMHNAALQRLAHATMNKGYLPASPLQAPVRLRGARQSHFAKAHGS